MGVARATLSVKRGATGVSSGSAPIKTAGSACLFESRQRW